MKTSTSFAIVAQADPQTLPRVINYFAQLGLVPRRVSAAVVNGLITMHIEQPGMSEHSARVVAEKMRSAILITAVRVERDGRELDTYGAVVSSAP